MDKVLVIGGAGFIGGALTRSLIEAGNDVTVASRSARSQSERNPRYVRADVADPARMMEVIAGFDVVYDLSMSMGTRWEEYERDYIGGANNVAQACLAHKVRRLIYTSSISALFLGGGGTLDESAGHDPNFQERGFYGRAKAEAENVLLRFHATNGLPVVIFRPGIVLGRGGWLIHPALGDKGSDTHILGFGPGTHKLPCVLVQDVAAALRLAKDAPHIDGKTFNLAGDVRPTAIEYVQLLRERTKRNIRFHPRSVWKMGLAEWSRWMLKALARKPDNQRLPFRDTQSMTMSSDLDCSLAKQLLGWRPVSDRNAFIQEALDCHISPMHPDDLRLSR